MANKGRRMVFEDDIKKIGQGGGTTYTAGDNITIEDNVISATDTTYTAGNGIDITNDAISVNYGTGLNVDDSSLVVDTYSLLWNGKLAPVAIGGNYNSLLDQPIAYVTYKVNPNMCEGETNQEKVTNWCKNMPILIGRGSGTAAALHQLGYTDIREMGVGETIIINGTFGIAMENSSSPYEFLNRVFIYGEFAANASANVFTRNTFTTYEIKKKANQEYTIKNGRCRVINTSLNSYVDPVNIAIELVSIQSSTSDVKLSLTNVTSYGIESTTAPLEAKSKLPTDNISTQLAAPTTAGTYQLEVTVDSDGYPTYAWVLKQ